MIFGFQINGPTIVITTDTRIHHVTEGSHPHYQEVKEALKNKEFDQAEQLLDIENSVREFGDGKLQVQDGTVTYKGRSVSTTLQDYILRMIEEDFSVDPMIAFLDNLYQNPSKRSVDELFTFLEYNMMPITEDGHFLAYKFVRSNFTDWHSGTFDNSPGAVVSMERNDVDDDKERTCSQGLHVCSLPYMKDWLGRDNNLRAVVVKVNPADVVSVPIDYENTKMRCCGYTVLSELDRDKFDFSDPDFGGAFDTVVDREFTGSDDFDGSVVDEDSLTPYQLGLKRGTEARYNENYEIPDIPDYDNFDDEEAYALGYDDGCSGEQDFYELFNTSNTVDSSGGDADSQADLTPYQRGLKDGTDDHYNGTDDPYFPDDIEYPDEEDYVDGYEDGYSGRKNYYELYGTKSSVEPEDNTDSHVGLTPYECGVDDGYKDQLNGGQWAPNPPREADGRIGAAFNQYMTGYRKGHNGDEVPKNKQPQPYNKWPNDDELVDFLFYQLGYSDSECYRALGLKHGTIARQRGEIIMRPSKKHADNYYYLEGYNDGILGDDYFDNFLAEYWPY